MAKVTREQVQLVQELVHKYAAMLGVDTLPKVVVRDHMKSKWLGRCVWRYYQTGPQSFTYTTTIELQKSILSHPKTLERIVAHEMVHHTDFATLTEQDLQALRSGRKRDGHGSRFQELAAQVNSAEGEGFVTKHSDESYVVEPSKKLYYLLVAPLEKYGFGYAYAVRITPNIAKHANRILAMGGRLLTLNDPYWMVHGVRIGGGMSVPRDAERQRMLSELHGGGA